MPFGQVNETEWKERGDEDKRGIQIEVSMEKMEGSRCHTYLKGRERETRGGCKEEKENERERGERSGAEGR